MTIGRPFQKGQSGNPSGRPKSKPFRDALNRIIKESGDDDEALNIVARALYNKARDGDVAALKEFADRFDGKVPQAIGGDDDMPAIKQILEVAWKSDASESN